MMTFQTITVGDVAEIHRLVHSARDGGTPDTYNGKRRHPRVKNELPLEVMLDTETGNDVHSASMHNVSEGGMAFWTKVRVERGRTAFIRQFSGESPHAWVKARVSHVTRGIRGFLVGCGFKTRTP
jgi:hypothetical protein